MVRMWIGLLVCCLGALPCAQRVAGEGPLRLGISVWPGYEPLYLARRRGLLDEGQVKLAPYRSATQAMHALGSAAIDACTLTLDEALTLTCGGLPLTIVLVTDVSSGGDSIVGQPEMARMEDLRGKRVGVESTALGAFMLLRALEVSGMSESDVAPVRMEVGRHVEAFKRGEIEASVCYEPTRSALLAQGGKELFSSAKMPGEIVDVIVVRTEAMSEHRQALRHLGEAWNRALKLITEAPDESYATLGERMGQDAAEARKSYAGLTLYKTGASAEMLSSEAFTEGTLPRLADFMRTRLLVKQSAAPTIDAGAVRPQGGR